MLWHISNPFQLIRSAPASARNIQVLTRTFVNRSSNPCSHQSIVGSLNYLNMQNNVVKENLIKYQWKPPSVQANVSSVLCNDSAALWTGFAQGTFLASKSG